ncbi:energy transducer TonB [Herbaspirillum sp. GCM10030257]|uniref:energy transducer TonB n=1 Tax=Herbaspirillum sp. GCM10030257 TaxID=3273393 RepID=UPI0036127E0B
MDTGTRKRSASVLPAVATLLLHVALIGVVVTGLGNKSQPKPDTPPKPIEVALLQAPTPPAPLPVTAEPAPTVSPAPPPSPPPEKPPEKRRPDPKPRVERKPAPKPLPPPREVPRTQAPDVTFDARPTPSSSSAVTTPPAPPPPPAPVAAATPVARTPVSIPARYAASNRKPEYPRMSRQMEEEGTVVLRVFVQADGSAGTVEIRTSSGFPLLDQSARNAVQSWRFEPATSDGKPVGEWFLIPIPFKLQN